MGNGNFESGLSEWTVWTERGSLDATVAGGELRLSSSDHNGGVYQQFATGGAGTTISVQGFWESNPTASNTQFTRSVTGPGTWPVSISTSGAVRVEVVVPVMLPISTVFVWS